MATLVASIAQTAKVATTNSITGIAGFGAVAGGLCSGPLIIVLGVLSVRVYSELLILVFQIHDTLVDIKDLLAQR